MLRVLYIRKKTEDQEEVKSHYCSTLLMSCRIDLSKVTILQSCQRAEGIAQSSAVAVQSSRIGGGWLSICTRSASGWCLFHQVAASVSSQWCICQRGIFVLCYCRSLADMNADGKMDKKEFSIAMFLIKKKLERFELPKVLPGSLKADPTPVVGSFGTMPMAAPAGGMGKMQLLMVSECCTHHLLLMWAQQWLDLVIGWLTKCCSY